MIIGLGEVMATVTPWRHQIPPRGKEDTSPATGRGSSAACSAPSGTLGRRGRLRNRVQPCPLPIFTGATRDSEAMVDDDTARPDGEDRRQDRPARTLHHTPYVDGPLLARCFA